MIRKQFYITEEQEKYLKEQTKQKGVREAEIVRRALDQYIESKKE